MKQKRVLVAGRSLFVGAALAAVTAGPAPAQWLLDLEARTSACPDALMAGPIAVFWNPALAQPRDGARIDALVIDVRAPESTGLGGLVAAGALRLDDQAAVGLGYRHAAVSGIHHTTTSPLSGGDEEIDVSEDALALSLSRRLGERTEFGAALRYGRTAEIAGGVAVFDIAAGMLVQPRLPWSPRVAGSIGVEDNDFDWNAGIGLSPIETAGWRFGACYGVSESHRVHGVTHRLGAGAEWANSVDVEAGVAIEPDGGSHAVTPVFGAGFALNRYRIGLLRESLANGLGEVYSFRFGIAFE